MARWLHGGAREVVGGEDGSEHLASDVALQAAHDLGLGLALGEASFDVGLGRRVVPHADQRDTPQGAVGLSVTAAVEPVAHDPTRGRFERCDAAEPSERCFAAEPFGVVADGDEERAGGVGADGEQFDELG
jgi:hypothetical protein